MENVLVGIRHTTLDAQVTVGMGAFALHREGVCVVLLHGDTTIEVIPGVIFNDHRIECDVHIVEKAEIAQGSVSVRHTALVVWEVFQDLYGAQK